MSRQSLFGLFFVALSLLASAVFAEEVTQPNDAAPVQSKPAQSKPAQSKPAQSKPVQSSAALTPSVPSDAQGCDPGRWFAGLSVFPVTTDHTFGAGFSAGWTRDFYAITMRESFLTSANRRISDTVLERVEQRFSFELTPEAVLRWKRAVLFVGAGGGVRHDERTQLQLVSGRFSEYTRDDWSVAPVLVFGFVGRFLEANVSVYLDDDPDARMGIGITFDR